MANNFSLDLNDQSHKTNVSDVLAKIGSIAMKWTEEETKLQRAAQQIMYQERQPLLDSASIHEALANYTPDRIVPEDYFERTQEYQQKSLEMLQSINQNTANLYTLVELINKSNEKQDEMIALIGEILSLAKAKSKPEAESIFKKLMGKITNTADNVEAMLKIVGWATTVYNYVLPMLEK